MPQLKKFDYFYLRYSPYPTMDDYVTFGLILMEIDPEGFAGVRFMKSWRRLLCSHPDADLDYFRFLEHDIREHLSNGVRREELLYKMRDCFGNSVQISTQRECLAEDGEASMELLAHSAIDLPTQTVKQELKGRRRILRKIETAFESVGIWNMVFKNVPVSTYTYPGDPLKMDVSYRPNETVKMLQAVSLQSNTDAVKALAFSYPQLTAGVKRKENAGTELTAIIEDDSDHNDPESGYILETLQRAGILVTMTSELPTIAEKARIELMA